MKHETTHETPEALTNNTFKRQRTIGKECPAWSRAGNKADNTHNHMQFPKINDHPAVTSCYVGFVYGAGGRGSGCHCF